MIRDMLYGTMEGIVVMAAVCDIIIPPPRP